VIDERRLADDCQSGSPDLYPIAIDDNALTALADDDADWPTGRQAGLPTFNLSGRKGLTASPGWSTVDYGALRILTPRLVDRVLAHQPGRVPFTAGFA
jgi:hypothetical protein